MSIRRDGQDPSGYLGVVPSERPANKLAQRAPTSNDRRVKIGTIWIDQTNNQVYQLTSVVSGTPNWTLLGPGASDVDTLTGDSGGALSPTAGNMNILGGTNMTVAGSGSTLTVNMDAAITLATSVTSALYTAAAAADFLLTVPAGQDGVFKMGDALAANKISFTDSADSEVAQINSDGAAQFDSSVTAGGNLILSSVATQIEMNGGAVTDFIGQATLSSGTVTVLNTNIAANDRIFLSRADLNSSSALGHLTVTAQTASTSFVITAVNASDGSSAVAGDSSIVNYVIIRQN